ncbi:hypothetical protein ACFWJU_06060 [Streptomyces mutabilis]|uniref:hypothetical protein n=1 Tax=Streptomyces mutabilis TaxID=67332 RepID=UPI003657DE2E
MAGRGFSDDELRLYELLQQFLALSDDETVAGRIIVQGPDGTIVGDATLAAADIEDATQALLWMNVQRAEALNVADEAIAAVGDEAEAFLRGGGLS